jgi:hypothetical protein
VIDEVRHKVGSVHNILLAIGMQQSTVTDSIYNYTLRHIVTKELTQTIQPTRCTAVSHSPSLMDSSSVLMVALCTGLSATVTSARMSTIESCHGDERMPD